MFMSDQLYCVDERCNLSEKLITNWTNFLQHQELEHKMLTIKQFKSYLIEKKSTNATQQNDERKFQYISLAKEKLDNLFDSIESRIQKLVKQELEEIFELCLVDLETQIQNCIVNENIQLDHFETYFQFEGYQTKCLNFYNNNIYNEIQDIINQFCKLKDIQFEGIFGSLTQSFSHQKYMIQQIEKSTTLNQKKIKENQVDLPSSSGHKQGEQTQQEYYQFKEQNSQSKPIHPTTLQGYNQVEKSQLDYFQNQDYAQESKTEALLPLKGYKQVEKVQQDYYQFNEYTQDSKPERPINQQRFNYADNSQVDCIQNKISYEQTPESYPPLKGYKQAEQKQNEYFSYKERQQDAKQEPSLNFQGFNQVEKIQQNYYQNKEISQESKIESKVKKNPVITQEVKPQANDQKQPKKLNLNQKKKEVTQVQQIQNKISEHVKDAKNPEFNELNGKLAFFTKQFMIGQVELLDNFKTAKSKLGFVLFDGFFNKTANIKLEVLIQEYDKQSVQSQQKYFRKQKQDQLIGIIFNYLEKQENHRKESIVLTVKEVNKNSKYKVLLKMENKKANKNIRIFLEHILI
ncbi:unnamed protein product (macronuclear) [Paramecium tetraurelia]|uniref:Uncharacterized protein n=1 Tax=Paramecium tetraurelia TaxID=5888 RepID=A0EGI9_PARTE|nr:uncharacterized protein GSPATT00026754001 [Paramecium tetraurelia]CAK94430.1 unnamed protein product [Paramecium tetraurelia]|eukprot:XP_001461803.1 hypothetical protein (macronuclear) [Paramecium tetraurelia strain d4-2]